MNNLAPVRSVHEGRRSDVLLDLIMMCGPHQMNGSDQIMFSGGPDD